MSLKHHRKPCGSYDELCAELLPLLNNIDEPAFKLDATLTLFDVCPGDDMERQCFSNLSNAIYNTTGYLFRCEDYSSGHFICAQSRSSTGSSPHPCHGVMDVKVFSSRLGECLLFVTLEHHAYHPSSKSETTSSQPPTSPQSTSAAPTSSQSMDHVQEMTSTNQGLSEGDSSPAAVTSLDLTGVQIASQTSPKKSRKRGLLPLSRCTNCNEPTIPPGSVDAQCSECHAIQKPLPKKRRRNPPIVEASSSAESDHEGGTRQKVQGGSPISCRRQDSSNICPQCGRNTLPANSTDQCCLSCKDRRVSGRGRRASKRHLEATEQKGPGDLDSLELSGSPSKPHDSLDDHGTEANPYSTPARFRKRVKLATPETQAAMPVLLPQDSGDLGTENGMTSGFKKCRSCKLHVVPIESPRRACETCLQLEVVMRREKKLRKNRPRDRIGTSLRTRPGHVHHPSQANSTLKSPSTPPPHSPRQHTVGSFDSPPTRASIINGFTIGSIQLEHIVLGMTHHQPSQSAIDEPSFKPPFPPSFSQPRTDDSKADQQLEARSATKPILPPAPLAPVDPPPTNPLDMDLDEENPDQRLSPSIDHEGTEAPLPPSSDLRSSPRPPTPQAESLEKLCEMCLSRPHQDGSHICATCQDRHDALQDYVTRRPKKSSDVPVPDPPFSPPVNLPTRVVTNAQAPPVPVLSHNGASSSSLVYPPPPVHPTSEVPEMYFIRRDLDFWAQRFARHFEGDDDDEQDEGKEDELAEPKECTACRKLHRTNFKSCPPCRARGRNAWRSRHARKKAEDVAKEVTELLKANGAVGNLKPAEFVVETSRKKRKDKSKRTRKRNSSAKEDTKDQPEASPMPVDDGDADAGLADKEEVPSNAESSCSFLNGDSIKDEEQMEDAPRPFYRAYYPQHDAPVIEGEMDVHGSDEEILQASPPPDDDSRLCTRCRKVRMPLSGYKQCLSCRTRSRHRRQRKSEGVKVVHGETSRPVVKPEARDDVLQLDSVLDGSSISVSAPPGSGNPDEPLDGRSSLPPSDHGSLSNLDPQLSQENPAPISPHPHPHPRPHLEASPSPEPGDDEDSVGSPSSPHLLPLSPAASAHSSGSEEPDLPAIKFQEKRCSGCRKMFMPSSAHLTCEACRAKRHRWSSRASQNKIKEQSVRPQAMPPSKLIIRIPARPRKPDPEDTVTMPLAG